ncbi:hypothetical protein U0070_026063, partial [Myodes glareolus]
MQKEDLRVDGRGCEDYRCVEVETDVVSNTSGSANATPEFEGRGGDDLGTEIANTLYRIFNNKSSVDLRSLCISPREHCWVLYVDVLLLECGGNLFDAISIAVKAALFSTRIPRVRVLEDEEGAKDIELSDDPYDCIRLSVENVPCIVTLCKVLLVSVTSKGVVTCMRKVGKGSLDPESIFEMMESESYVASDAFGFPVFLLGITSQACSNLSDSTCALKFLCVLRTKAPKSVSQGPWV